MADDSRIVGVDHLLSQLDKLSLTEGKQIIARSLRRGPQLIAEEAARLAPKLTGKLSENIVVSVQEQTATHAIARVGPARSAFYGRFAEYGTEKMQEEPFLEPAFEAKKDEAVAAIAEDLARLIEEAIR